MSKLNHNQPPQQQSNAAGSGSNTQVNNSNSNHPNNTSSHPAVDEMFPERFDGIRDHGPRSGSHFSYFEELEAAGGSLMREEWGREEKLVHTDFYNNFDDLFDDENLEVPKKPTAQM